MEALARDKIIWRKCVNDQREEGRIWGTIYLKAGVLEKELTRHRQRRGRETRRMLAWEPKEERV